MNDDPGVDPSGVPSDVLADVLRRLEVLERLAAEAGLTGRPAAPGPSEAVTRLLAEVPVDGVPGDGTVTYSGAGLTADGQVAWQMTHSWADLLAADPTVVASCLAALASPLRIALVRRLAEGGAVTRPELSESLGEPSPGQLSHHLRELLAAGLIHQPGRGGYAVRAQHVIPLLALIAAAADLAAAPVPPSVAGPAEETSR